MESEDSNTNEQPPTYLPGQQRIEDAWLSSDEERDIIQEIKEEIKGQVRHDIQNELAQYDLRNLPSRTESVASSCDASALEGVESILPQRDIKYQEAYKRMLKLDKILRRKMAKEREVKRERAMLEKRIKQELDELQESRSTQRSKDEVTNTMKFLALAPSSQQESDLLRDEYSEPHTPVFQTEYVFEDQIRASMNESTGEKGTQRSTERQNDGSHGSNERRSRHGKKDFLKRNIELAAAANEVVAMTPEEHERLERLLQDLESIPELPELLDESLPQMAMVAAGEGFRVTEHQEQRLREIDRSLAQIGALVPQVSSRLLSSSQSDVSGLSGAYRTSALHEMQLDGGDTTIEIEKFGEKALAEVREERMMDQRLQELDHCLSALSEKPPAAPLSEEQLSNLLSDCVQSISQSQLSSSRDLQSELQSEMDVSELDGNAALSSRSAHQLTAIAPLQQSVIDRLVAEAREAGIGQNWAHSQAAANSAEELEDSEERLVLPDIKMFACMSAPRSAGSGRYSAN